MWIASSLQAAINDLILQPFEFQVHKMQLAFTPSCTLRHNVFIVALNKIYSKFVNVPASNYEI